MTQSAAKCPHQVFIEFPFNSFYWIYFHKHFKHCIPGIIDDKIHSQQYTRSAEVAQRVRLEPKKCHKYLIGEASGRTFPTNCGHPLQVWFNCYQSKIICGRAQLNVTKGHGNKVTNSQMFLKFIFKLSIPDTSLLPTHQLLYPLKDYYPLYNAILIHTAKMHQFALLHCCI